jgi:hypothetical protein
MIQRTVSALPIAVSSAVLPALARA